MSSDEDRAKEILKGFKLYPFTVGRRDAAVRECSGTLATLAATAWCCGGVQLANANPSLLGVILSLKPQNC